MDVDSDICPISLTPIIAKDLEVHVRDWFMDILEEDIDQYQFGSLGLHSDGLSRDGTLMASGPRNFWYCC